MTTAVRGAETGHFPALTSTDCCSSGLSSYITFFCFRMYWQLCGKRHSCLSSLQWMKRQILAKTLLLDLTLKSQTFSHMVRKYRHTQTSQMNIYFEVLHASPTCSFSVAKQGSLLGSPNDSSKGFHSSSSNFTLPTVSSCMLPFIRSLMLSYNARCSNPACFSSLFVRHMVPLLSAFLLLSFPFSRSPHYHHFFFLSVTIPSV